MAVKAFTKATNIGSIQNYRWDLTTADAYGAVLEISDYADKTVHIFADSSISGTYGGTGVGAMQGTNDPRALVGDGNTADWVPLTDAQGNAITSSSGSKLEVIQENPRFIRPALTTPGTAAILSFIISTRKAF